MADIDLQVHHLGDGLDQINIIGRLDSAGAQVLDQPLKALIAGAAQGVLIDLSQVPFLGSMGIRSLLTSAQAMRRRGGALALRPHHRRTLRRGAACSGSFRVER